MKNRLSYKHVIASNEIDADYKDLIIRMEQYEHFKSNKQISPKMKKQIQEILSRIIHNKEFLSEDFSLDIELLVGLDRIA